MRWGGWGSNPRPRDYEPGRPLSLLCRQVSFSQVRTGAGCHVVTASATACRRSCEHSVSKCSACFSVKTPLATASEQRRRSPAPAALWAQPDGCGGACADDTGTVPVGEGDVCGRVTSSILSGMPLGIIGTMTNTRRATSLTTSSPRTRGCDRHSAVAAVARGAVVLPAAQGAAPERYLRGKDGPDRAMSSRRG